MKYLAVILGSALIQFAASSCGNAHSANTKYAELIQSNKPGYSCFLIYDENGKAVGGSCVKD